MEPAAYSELRAAEDRFWWYVGLHGLASDRLAEALAVPGAPRASGVHEIPGATRGKGRPRLLDAGCGTGGMLARVAASGLLGREPLLYGIDASRLALGLARQREGLCLAAASVSALPFPDASFDAALSLDVLYHRGVPDDLAALREIRRCLRPGGALVLNLPAYEALRSSHDAAVHTARRYTRGGLARLLAEAGFEVERITYWNTLLFPGLAAVRILRRGAVRPGRAVPASDVRPLPGPLNAVLGAVLALERRWLRRRDFGFGLSVLAAARRPCL